VSSDRQHDIVVYGATGFVGALLAAYLADHAPHEARIALAGRSQAKLEALRGQLPARAHDWPIIVADADDLEALGRLAASTTGGAATGGPDRHDGLPQAPACAEAGTHYADLTGEVLFVRRVVDECDARAKVTGARIVTACGYDSIPSDLGVHRLHERAEADAAGGLLDTTLLARAKGGLSGGTIDSSRTQVDTVMADRRLARVVFDPYALSPDRKAEPDLGKERDPSTVFVDEQTGQWVGPFIMAAFNTRIVRRSNALRGHAYGRRFRYRELSSYGRGLKGRRRATIFSGGLGLAFKALANPRTRPLFDRLVPKPGEGPDAARRAVRCGVEMVEAVERLRDPRADLAVGVGVSTGDVVYGPIGSGARLDFTVIGDVVNTGARLCSAAAGGQVIVSRAVLDDCQGGLGDIEFNALEPMRVKNKREPLEVYSVTRVRAT
jgi:short subunit dehydrogenase-like uncharacterized protein